MTFKSLIHDNNNECGVDTQIARQICQQVWHGGGTSGSGWGGEEWNCMDGKGWYLDYDRSRHLDYDRSQYLDYNRSPYQDKLEFQF